MTAGILLGNRDQPIPKGTYLARNTISSSIAQSSFAFGFAISKALDLVTESNKVTSVFL